MQNFKCSFAYSISMQVEIEEDQFRTESKKLAVHLADPEVEVRIVCLLYFLLS